MAEREAMAAGAFLAREGWGWSVDGGCVSEVVLKAAALCYLPVNSHIE